MIAFLDLFLIRAVQATNSCAPSPAKPVEATICSSANHCASRPL
jgi:hypothetical protein